MTDYYVAADASGGGSGTSTGDPFDFDEMMSEINSSASGNTFHVQAGTYDVDGSYIINASGGNNAGAEIVGYKTTPGDLDSKISTGASQTFGTDLPVFETTDSSNSFGIDGSFWSFRNLAFKSTVDQPGFYLRTYNSSYRNCHFLNTNGSGSDSHATIADNARNTLIACSFRNTNSANTVFASVFTSHTSFYGCYFSHANSSSSLLQYGGYGAFANNIFAGGARAVYAYNSSTNNVYLNNTFYNQATSSLQLRDNTGLAAINNIFHTCGTGIDVLSQSAAYDGLIIAMENNLYYNCTNPVSSYINTLIPERDRITASSDPLTNAASGDFSLVDGADGIGAAYPYQMPHVANRQYIDVGAMQKEAGSGGGFQRITMNGGMNG